ncbi:MAG: hypothetical protein M1833_003694 [Piccolia ochrophora]|nr:MAG: hypothetical protein M1833_003694 [Piccolia ochrophora]
MSLVASRALLRRPHFLLRRPALRNASTTSSAAEAASSGASKASEAASSTTSKASQGLSRVTSSAGPAIAGATKGLGQALGRVGGRTGRLIAFIESIIPPTIYYSKVTLELSKLVFQAQKMSPPPLSTFQSYLQPAVNALRNPTHVFTQTTTATNALTPSKIYTQIRSINREQLVTAGVVAAETIGFFTVGEMLGRFKIVGYRGEKGEHH